MNELNGQYQYQLPGFDIIVMQDVNTGERLHSTVHFFAPSCELLICECHSPEHGENHICDLSPCHTCEPRCRQQFQASTHIWVHKYRADPIHGCHPRGTEIDRNNIQSAECSRLWRERLCGIYKIQVHSITSNHISDIPQCGIRTWRQSLPKREREATQAIGTRPTVLASQIQWTTQIPVEHEQ